MAPEKTEKSSTEEDRLSNLLDDLLSRILCFLDVKSAAKTRVLAKRWRYLFSSLPHLNFIYQFKFTTEGGAESFKEIVNHVLKSRHHQSSPIRSCSIDFCPFIEFNGNDKHVLSWMNTLATEDLEEFSLKVTIEKIGFQLPETLFNCRRLRKLELNCALRSPAPLDFYLQDSMSLPKLTSLHLCRVSIKGDEVPNKIFMVCPELESLSLMHTEFHERNPCFTSQKLKHMVIDFPNCYGLNKQRYKFSIDTPNLESFRLNDYFSNEYFMMNVSAVVKACIDLKFKKSIGSIQGTYTDKRKSCAWLVNFVGAFKNVEVFKFSAECLEVVSEVWPASGLSFQFSNLKCLRLLTNLSELSIKGINIFLEISPAVESLSLTSIIVEDQIKPGEQFWDEMLQISLHNLKFIEIRGVIGHKNELLFLRFLLRTATALKSITLYSERQLKEFVKSLKKLPRASPSIVFITPEP